MPPLVKAVNDPFHCIFLDVFLHFCYQVLFLRDDRKKDLSPAEANCQPRRLKRAGSFPIEAATMGLRGPVRRFPQESYRFSGNFITQAIGLQVLYYHLSHEGFVSY